MLTPQQWRVLVVWIEENLVRYPKAHRNRTMSSYTLKHNFEASPQGFYITADAFERAMAAAGFRGRRREGSPHRFYWLRLRESDLDTPGENR